MNDPYTDLFYGEKEKSTRQMHVAVPCTWYPLLALIQPSNDRSFGKFPRLCASTIGPNAKADKQ
jgi:hypothetical protein